MNYYWAKLRFSYLDDFKLGTLPDWVFRRYFLCYMVAGEIAKEGELPALHELAWRIRDENKKNLRDALQAMSEAGLAELTDPEKEIWTLTRFAVEQEAVSGAERKAAQRARARKGNKLQSGHEGVTDRDTEEDGVIDKEKESSASSAARAISKDERGLVFREYERNIGAITKVVREEINDYIDNTDGQSPVVMAEWLIAAFQEAAKYNKRSWAYSEKIIKRWLVEGKGSDNRDSEEKKASSDASNKPKTKKQVQGGTEPDAGTLAAAEEINSRRAQKKAVPARVGLP